MGGKEKKIFGGLGLALLAATGLGAAGIGPLAGMLSGGGAAAGGAGAAAAGAGAAASGAGAAGAAGTGAATAAGGATAAALPTFAASGSMAPALGLLEGATAAGSGAGAGAGVAASTAAKAAAPSLFADILSGGAKGALTTGALSAAQPETTVTTPQPFQMNAQDPNSVFQIIQELQARRAPGGF